jgi:hypothetical protein
VHFLQYEDKTLLALITKTIINPRFLPAFSHAAYRLVALNTRNHFYIPRASAHNLTYLPHAFPLEEAAKRIVEHDQNRLFSPLPKKSFALIASEKSPLTAALVPVCGIYADVASTDYEGQIGRDRVVYDYHYDDKGNCTTTTRIVTDWFYVSGTVGSCRYAQHDSNMTIYFGERYNDRTIETAVERHNVKKFLQPFDKEKINKDISIDPWTKVDGFGISEGQKRIRNAELQRVKDHMWKKNWSVDHVHVDRFQVHYRTHRDGLAHFGLDAMMLPVYILEYPHNPIRVLSAISPESKEVVGSAPISSVKVMAATTAATAVISIFFPQIAIPVRISAILGTALASGSWAHLNPSAKHFFEQRRTEQQKTYNASFPRSPIDNARIEATADFNGSETIGQSEAPKPKLEVDPRYYEALGLHPDDAITSESVQAAFTNNIKKVHTDLGGNDAKTREIIEARKAFQNAFSKQGKRQFSTYRNTTPKAPSTETLFKEPPRSHPHPNAGYLIWLVLDAKDEKKALRLIENGELNADGHDPAENTLLTAAVERKDVNGVKFALTQAKCSVDLSCDCPLHNTAMHYWAQGAGANGGEHRQAEEQIFKLLIEHKARINLINSAGQTPLDMTTDKTATRMLLSQGALKHRTQEGMAGLLVRVKGTLLGYRPDQRTLLMKQTQEQLTESSGQKKLP